MWRNQRIKELEANLSTLFQTLVDTKASLAAAEKENERIRISVTEMWNDWKKDDFDLPKLAQLDLRSVMEAAGKGPLLEMIDAAKEKNDASSE